MKSFLTDKKIAVTNGKGFRLKKYDPAYKADINKEAGLQQFEKIKQKLSVWQDKLYAQDKFSLLLVFQAMDAAGKDGTIKSVMTGVNPQGVDVVSFKKPSAEELDHDYLWRCYKSLPQRGRIGIFNRSYYEEVLVTRVHPEFIMGQHLPSIKSPKQIDQDFWENRFESIRNFEKHLSDNGTVILKFFLNVSKAEQKQRFLERIAEPEKNWKFSYADLQERKHWDSYMQAYEEAIAATARPHAPWFVIPSDSNWFRHLTVCSILHETLKNMGLRYPAIDDETRLLLEKGRDELMNESN
ncbi:MAG: polyphosphate kinase 2 family protein [Bacteroidetes bacterium]|nr:polyphosphate kinase 2 family protein [Bacteroidota bacterium]